MPSLKEVALTANFSIHRDSFMVDVAADLDGWQRFIGGRGRSRPLADSVTIR